MSRTVKWPGIALELGGEEYVFAPLTLGFLEQHKAELDALSGSPDPAFVVEMATASLRRNYPQMTREQVAELVDLGNMLAVITTTTDASGALRKRLAEEQGKPIPVLEWTGWGSTLISPPAPDGASSTSAST